MIEAFFKSPASAVEHPAKGVLKSVYDLITQYRQRNRVP